MNRQEIRTLELLKAIEKEQVSSQRDIARKLDVSLGLVNSFIKRLVQKGYFKISTVPKNRIKYILTPKGVAEKSRLTYLYIQYSLNFYKTARQELRKLFHGFQRSGVRRILFFGASDLAEIAYVSLQETAIELVAVVDEQRAGQQFLGTMIQAPDAIHAHSVDKILITVPDAGAEMVERLVQSGIPRDKLAVIG